MSSAVWEDTESTVEDGENRAHGDFVGLRKTAPFVAEGPTGKTKSRKARERRSALGYSSKMRERAG